MDYPTFDIDHPEAGRFGAYDRGMMRQIGVIVAPPESPCTANTIDIETARELADRREEIKRQIPAMVDVPV